MSRNGYCRKTDVLVFVEDKGYVQNSDDDSGDNIGNRMDSIRDMGVYGTAEGKE